MASAFEQAVAKFGKIDIVVSNAAYSVRKPVIEAQWEDTLRTLEVTQFGAYPLCAHPPPPCASRTLIDLYRIERDVCY